ncbi:MAG: 6-phospho-3-hexuloisomerase [Methanomassiliicoccales archaeon]
MKEASNFIISEVKESLEKVDPALSEKVCDAILGARVVFIYGVGRSGLVGKAFGVRLVQMGLDVHFIGDTTTPIVQKEDLLLVISNTGETMSAVQTANIVGRIGAEVVVITSNQQSKLGRTARIIVEIQPCRKEERSKLAPLGTIFEVASLIYLDSLVPLLMQKLNQSEASLRKRHAIWV